MAKKSFLPERVGRSGLFFGGVAVLVVVAGVASGLDPMIPAAPKLSNIGPNSVTISDKCDIDGDLGTIITQQREVEDFSKIFLGAGLKFGIEVGGEPSLIVSGYEGILADVESSVDKGALDLRWQRDGEWCSSDTLKAIITLPTLEVLEIKGGVKGDVSGIAGGNFIFDLKGAGDIDLAGSCDRFTVELRGAGEVDAGKLVCKHVKVELKGAGAVEVNATDSVDAQLKGIGEIVVKGNPPVVHKVVKGLGSIDVD